MKKVCSFLFLSLLSAGIAFGPGGPSPARGAEGSLLEGSLYSVSLSRQMPYRIFLPPGYFDPRADAVRFPVLYLLHGHEEEEHYLGHTHWTERTEVAAIADSYEMIIVFPEGLRSWYSNYHDSTPGTDRFEDYLVRDLIGHVDETYRTRPERESRAIAGNSMGGHGAMKLAARHPDLFCAAASLSGIFDLSLAGVASHLEPIFPNNMRTVFGPHPKNLIYYQGNSAVSLAANFASPGDMGSTHTRLHFNTGLLDHYLAPLWAIEYARVLDGLGIPYDAAIYGGDWETAGHNWTYWGNHIGEVLEFVSAVFAAPPDRPGRWRYRTIESSFEVWGWTFLASRPVFWAWIELIDAGPEGFDLMDEGTTRTLSVEAPSLWDPGIEYQIVAEASGGRVLSEIRETADESGALRFSLDLGGRDRDSDPGEDGTATVHVEIFEDRESDSGEAHCGGCAHVSHYAGKSGVGASAQIAADLTLFLLPIGALILLLKRKQ